MDTWQLPYLWHVIAILSATALLYGSFQAGVSVLTVLSSHQLGAQSSHKTLLRLCSRYILGALLTSAALVFSLTYLLGLVDRPSTILWAIICGYAAAIGVVVTFFYYRSGPGTLLWLPRGVANFLNERAKKTKSGVESFSLGVMTTLAELPFIIAPVAIVAMMFRGGATINRVIGELGFVMLAALPLVIILSLISGGVKISRIQKWREKNKGFLQVTAGLGLIVVSGYLYVSYCMGAT